MAKLITRKWKLSDLWTLLRNAVSAIFTGNLLLRMNAGKYFIHIAYTFLLCWILIFESLMAENTLNKVEKNKAKLHELEIVYADKTFEVASMSRRSEVSRRLKAMGSAVDEPTEQAISIE
ncbi:MAG: hypothetical protein IJ222_07630 [Bacteroidales bacterium]|nr:hypothetical protein [Bacteroidales bacterium]